MQLYRGVKALIEVYIFLSIRCAIMYFGKRFHMPLKLQKIAFNS